MATKALVAVDLHGTIADKNDQHSGEYDPSNYDLQPGAVEALKELKNDGHEIAIWTCWDGAEAKRWLDTNGVPYDYVNEEAPDHGSPKIDADLYVDDKAIRHEGDWNATLAAMYASGRLEKSMTVRVTRKMLAEHDGKVYVDFGEGTMLGPFNTEDDAMVAHRGEDFGAGVVISRPDWARKSIVTKPSGTKVDDVYQALLREGKDEGTAARIAQAQTGEALATGRAPKKSFRYVGKSCTGGEVWYRS